MQSRMYGFTAQWVFSTYLRKWARRNSSSGHI
jgi:hypothetical protein